MRRIAYSLLSTLLGWLVGLAYYIVISALSSPYGRPTDVEAILYWTSVFTFIGWLVFVVPLAWFVAPTSSFFEPKWSPLVGAIAGLAVFSILLGWWTGFWTAPLYVGYAVVIGAVTALSYSLILRIVGRVNPDHD